MVKQAALGGIAYTMTKDQVRATAHRIADFVYEKLTGDKGVFSTRIAYVVKRGNRYELQIADADGEGAETALASFEPIISPVLVARRPAPRLRVVREQEAGGLRALAARRQAPGGGQLQGLELRPGLGAGRQDHRRDALARGRLADLPAQSRRQRCAAHHDFVGDRHRAEVLARRQVDLLHVRPRRHAADLPHGPTGGEPQRVTFEGSYNVSPRPSPDGKSLAYITRNSGKFQVALQDLANRQVQIITDSDRDESPSFAPNGRMILFATVIGGRGLLSAVSADGRFKQRLSAATGGDVREPAWGPFIE